MIRITRHDDHTLIEIPGAFRCLNTDDLVKRARDAERQRCIAIARGCTDYLGGYTGPEQVALLEAFHHGIQTVVNALSAPSGDRQAAVVERIGAEAVATVAPADEWATWAPWFDSGIEFHDTREAAEEYLIGAYRDDLQDTGEDRSEDDGGYLLAVVGHVESVKVEIDDVEDDDDRALMEREGFDYLVTDYRIASGSGHVVVVPVKR